MQFILTEKVRIQQVGNELLVKRTKWLDCAKAVAILAVIADHTYGILYQNIAISRASFFSVSLFVLSSGIAVQRGERKTFSHQLKKVSILYMQYALATFILLVVNSHFFDLRLYVNYLLNFSISPPYYYILFFLQLMLIAPGMLAWCDFCDAKKGKIVSHALTLIALCWMASVFIRFTYILPVHGGGQYLFGGTYIILYYIGILFSKYEIFDVSRWTKSARVVCCLVTLLIFISLVYVRLEDKLLLDNFLEPYWGDGINPPSVQAMLLSLTVLFGCFSFFTLLEECSWKWVKFFEKVFTIIGQNTLYVFLYHLIVRDIIRGLLPENLNIWIIRLVVWVSMVLLPILVVFLIKKLRSCKW